MNSQDNPIFVSHLTKWDVFKCSYLAFLFNVLIPNLKNSVIIPILYFTGIICCILELIFIVILPFSWITIFLICCFLLIFLVPLILAILLTNSYPLHTTIPLNHPIKNKKDLKDIYQNYKLWQTSIKNHRYNWIITTKNFLIFSGATNIKKDNQSKRIFLLFIIPTNKNKEILLKNKIYTGDKKLSKHYINLG